MHCVSRWALGMCAVTWDRPVRCLTMGRPSGPGTNMRPVQFMPLDTSRITSSQGRG